MPLGSGANTPAVPVSSSEQRLVVRNRVNAPFELVSLDGVLLLPALGETEPARFSEEQVLVMRASLGLEVSEVSNGRGQEEPDTGKPLGEDRSVLARLRGEYSELTGKKPFHGWDAAELQKRVDTALAT